MKSIIAACLALLTWAIAASSGQAFCGPICAPMCCLTYEMQKVVCYRPDWREEKVPCVVQQVNYRCEVTPVKVQVMVPRMFDQQVRTACYVPTPREVERDVPRCIMTPCVVIDPVTCCPVVTYTPQWFTQKVRCVEYEYRLVEGVQNVQVCRYVPEDRVVQQVRYIPEVSQVQTWTVRRYCVMVPYETMVCVPCWRCP